MFSLSQKTLGIISGIGPESTIDYYRAIIAAYRELKQDGSYPPIFINSIDLTKTLNMVAANDLAKLTHYLLGELRKLASAGAELALIAANTPHIVFDDIRRESPIALLSVVEATCDAAKALALRRPALFGTPFTMQGRFYPDVFAKEGITLVPPEPDEQAYIHDKYMNELVNGIFLSETRDRLLAIVDRLKAHQHIDGVILAGTELPLILRDVNADIPFLDTTRIHVKSAVARLWS